MVLDLEQVEQVVILAKVELVKKRTPTQPITLLPEAVEAQVST